MTKYDKNKSLTENAMAGVDITEPELPTELILTENNNGYSLPDEFCESVNEYLSDRYGYCNNGWCVEIKLTNIDWDMEE